MKKREIPVMNLGISLIILIFMNVCLAAFAVAFLQKCIIGLCTYEEDGGAYNAVL